MIHNPTPGHISRNHDSDRHAYPQRSLQPCPQLGLRRTIRRGLIRRRGTSVPWTVTQPLKE